MNQKLGLVGDENVLCELEKGIVINIYLYKYIYNYISHTSQVKKTLQQLFFYKNLKIFQLGCAKHKHRISFKLDI